MLVRTAFVLICGFSLIAPVSAAEPADAWPPVIQRKLPPLREPLAEADRKQVETALQEIRTALGTESFAAAADVAIFAKAIDYALRHGEFFDGQKSVQQVEAVRKQALERIAGLKDGTWKWSERRGPLVRGYQSKLDDSYQPYSLVIPEGLDLSKPVPLYVWLHGRSDTMCDLQFIYSHSGTKAPGPLQPPSAIVLHPFGRFCNGWKSAGEVDVFEAIADVKQKYKIDEDRIVLAGFSMGGAGAWHLGAHYADRWCAVHAGAGFVDVRRYQNLIPEKFPSLVEQKLWGLYDVPDYRRNLLNVPVLAYSGEEDKQKAAADIMEAELKAEGYPIPHLIGPKMGHKYDPEVLKDIHVRLAKLVEKGRNPLPQKVTLQTKTLRYHKMFWVEALGLEQHWEDSRIDAESDGKSKITVATKGVTAFKLMSPFGWGDDAVFREGTTIVVDGQMLGAPGLLPTAQANNVLYFIQRASKWTVVRTLPYDFQPEKFRRKLPGLQGPIDDAFMEPFSVVGPSTTQPSTDVNRWTTFEHQHFLDRWRMLMRGEPRAGNAYPKHLVLWGTPQTNVVLADMLKKLPLRWTDETIGIGELEFDARKVVPVMIYPNPDDPSKYVVLNSGFTFRESHDRTNSLQNPKLGDWAFIDVTEPPTDEAPGKVLASGFFDEQWQYVPKSP